MSKRIFIVLMIGLLVLPFMSSISTPIKIKTSSNSEIHLTILDPSEGYFKSLDFFKKESDFYGDAEFVYEGDESTFDLMIVIKKFGERIYSKKFREGFTAGEEIYIEAIPEGYSLIETPVQQVENITNSTNSTDTSELINESSEIIEENSMSITGHTVASSSFLSFKTLYYILGFIGLLALAFFGLKFKNSRQPRKIKITKLSELQNNINEEQENSTASDSLERQEVENTSKLEREQRIKELQEKINKEKEELDRLLRG